jgi:hypothetical protein
MVIDVHVELHRQADADTESLQPGEKRPVPIISSHCSREAVFNAFVDAIFDSTSR